MEPRWAVGLQSMVQWSCRHAIGATMLPWMVHGAAIDIPATVVGGCNWRFYHTTESEHRRNIQSSCHQIQSDQCFGITDKIENMGNGNTKDREIELLERAQI